MIGILNLIASKSVVFCETASRGSPINRQALRNLLPTEMVRIGTEQPWEERPGMPQSDS